MSPLNMHESLRDQWAEIVDDLDRADPSRTIPLLQQQRAEAVLRVAHYDTQINIHKRDSWRELVAEIDRKDPRGREEPLQVVRRMALYAIGKYDREIADVALQETV